MITKRAKDGFDQLFKRALKASLVRSANDLCEVSELHEMSEISEQKAVILTVSSYVFRLIVLIYFSSESETKEYFANKNNIETSAMSEQSFIDAIAECGNICCGILNRELSAFYPHIGMSTPNIIDKKSASYLGSLDAAHIQHFQCVVNESFQFHASICVRAYGDLDFSVKDFAEDISTGELELF